MSDIKILSDKLTNKIAAGEVVQRPASLVKELVENSLDAGASEIIVRIKNGGKTLCEVTDDGQGMDKDDLLLAFERYATSKISTVQDLSNIRSLGFRGEALASIAAVAKVDALSTKEGSDTGHILRIRGGKFLDVKPAPPKPGSQISVRNLFYNVPARRKFLKSKNVEFRHIVKIMRKFSLIHPNIRFKLVHNGREVFNLKSENLKNRIVHLFSSEYKDNLIRIDSARGSWELSGYLGNLNLVRARRKGQQFLYVNGRSITDKYMSHAILSGYSSLVSRGEFPFYCLQLRIPPEEVDVNVHPSKMEVKFTYRKKLYRFIKDTIKRSVSSLKEDLPDFGSLSPQEYYSEPKVKKPGQQQAPQQEKGEQNQKQATNQPMQSDKKIDHQQPQKPLQTKKDSKQTNIPMHFTHKVDSQKWTERAERFSKKREQDQQTDQESYQPDVKVFQVHKKYIISQIESGIVIIDQHVAHERILFEEALKSMKKGGGSAQQLLFPQVVELSVDDYSVLLDILPYLEKMGFRAKKFGKNTVAVEAVPAGMRIGDEGKAMKKIIDHYREYGTKETDIQEKVAAAYACKAAIKAGDPLEEEEMRNLVDRLFATENPLYCPHGRPVVVNLTLKELDKRFERTG
ncbi:MAG: DNA mismatch repair endonuclease MutL [Candidatus Marinimicrobia bacterium]|nr:DNA mismatch repair endonuclease MutL [Candidatus Neomarinimicrobiota bacterium]